MKTSRIAISGLLVAMFILACGGGDDDGSQSATSAGGTSSAIGPGISIEEAKSSSLAGPLLVNGFLIVKGGDVRLCSALAESYPPQCAGESLKVEGADLSRFEGLQQAEDTRWSDQIQLLGEIEGDTLKVSQNVTG